MGLIHSIVKALVLFDATATSHKAPSTFRVAASPKRVPFIVGAAQPPKKSATHLQGGGVAIEVLPSRFERLWVPLSFK